MFSFETFGNTIFSIIETPAAVIAIINKSPSNFLDKLEKCGLSATNFHYNCILSAATDNIEIVDDVFTTMKIKKIDINY